jgi:hypothetical protein
MLFHQIQLMVCAALAQRWGRRAETLSSWLQRTHFLDLRDTAVERK